jgi:hypothetical protein
MIKINIIPLSVFYLYYFPYHKRKITFHFITEYGIKYAHSDTPYNKYNRNNLPSSALLYAAGGCDIKVLSNVWNDDWQWITNKDWRKTWSIAGVTQRTNHRHRTYVFLMNVQRREDSRGWS